MLEKKVTALEEWRAIADPAISEQDKKITEIEELINSALQIIEEMLSRKKNCKGLSDNEKEEYQKIKDHFKDKEKV